MSTSTARPPAPIAAIVTRARHGIGCALAVGLAQAGFVTKRRPPGTAA